MKKIVLFGLVFWSVASAFGTNWYVRPTSQGSNNGTNWSNAWSWATMTQASILPGDTVWMAGGATSYPTQIDIRCSGTSGNPVTFKRATVADAAATSATGWSSAFDAQILFDCSPARNPGFSITADYVTIDGRTPNGIKIFQTTTNSWFGIFINGHQGQVLSYMEIAGPGSTASPTVYQNGLGAGLVDGPAVLNASFNYLNVHGLVQNMTLKHVGNCVFDHCEIWDNGNANWLSPGAPHANLIEYIDCQNNTFRYCYFHNWQAVGFEVYLGGTPSLLGPASATFYGCRFATAQDVYWLSDNTSVHPGAFQFFNSTFVDCPAVINRGQTLTPGAGSIAQNNLFYFTNPASVPWLGAGQITNRDYEFSNTGGVAGAHSIGNGVNPFVNLGTADYHIISTISATLPRNKGVALAPTYNTDPDGNQRGGAGDAWDIGAYEVGGPAPPTTTPLFFIQFFPGVL